MADFRNHLIRVVLSGALAVALAGGVGGLAVSASAHSGDHDTVPADRANTTSTDSHDADHHGRDRQQDMHQGDPHDGHMYPGQMHRGYMSRGHMYRGHTYRGHMHYGPMGPAMMRRH